MFLKKMSILVILENIMIANDAHDVFAVYKNMYKKLKYKITSEDFSHLISFI